MFRWLILATFVPTLTISAYFRARARRLSGTIPRRAEGGAAMALRAIVALPLFLSIVAYVISPPLLDWSAIDLPDTVRWIGAVAGLLCIPSAWWLFRSIGANVSETVLTKEHHQLVTIGPYRWVRHPLYATGGLLLIAAGLMASNWFVLLLAVVALVLVRIVVVPAEERNLIARFGDAYRDYRRRTGALLPRL